MVKNKYWRESLPGSNPAMSLSIITIWHSDVTCSLCGHFLICKKATCHKDWWINIWEHDFSHCFFFFSPCCLRAAGVSNSLGLRMMGYWTLATGRCWKSKFVWEACKKAPLIIVQPLESLFNTLWIEKIIIIWHKLEFLLRNIIFIMGRWQFHIFFTSYHIVNERITITFFQKLGWQNIWYYI